MTKMNLPKHIVEKMNSLKQKVESRDSFYDLRKAGFIVEERLNGILVSKGSQSELVAYSDFSVFLAGVKMGMG